MLQDNGDAAEFPLMHRLWLIYPFMHSEKLEQLEVLQLLLPLQLIHILHETLPGQWLWSIALCKYVTAQSFPTEVGNLCLAMGQYAGQESKQMPSVLMQIGLGLIQQMVDASEKLPDATEAQQFLRSALNYFKAHHQVVKQWGRYPHRNQVLSRDTTPEEEEGMANGTIPQFA